MINPDSHTPPRPKPAGFLFCCALRQSHLQQIVALFIFFLDTRKPVAYGEAMTITTKSGTLEIKERWFVGGRIDMRGSKMFGDGKCSGDGDAIPCDICGKLHEVSWTIFPASRKVALSVGTKCKGHVMRIARRFR